jgi:hypothetical protein
MWATSAIFTILPKVNNHPIGKISPNLVTLVFYTVYGFLALVRCFFDTTRICSDASTSKDDSVLSRHVHRRPAKTRSASQIVQNRLSCGEFLLAPTNGAQQSLPNSSLNGENGGT